MIVSGGFVTPREPGELWQTGGRERKACSATLGEPRDGVPASLRSCCVGCRWALPSLERVSGRPVARHALEPQRAHGVFALVAVEAFDQQDAVEVIDFVLDEPRKEVVGL